MVSESTSRQRLVSSTESTIGSRTNGENIAGSESYQASLAQVASYNKSLVETQAAEQSISKALDVANSSSFSTRTDLSPMLINAMQDKYGDEATDIIASANSGNLEALAKVNDVLHGEVKDQFAGWFKQNADTIAQSGISANVIQSLNNAPKPDVDAVYNDGKANVDQHRKEHGVDSGKHVSGRGAGKVTARDEVNINAEMPHKPVDNPDIDAQRAAAEQKFNDGKNANGSVTGAIGAIGNPDLGDDWKKLF